MQPAPDDHEGGPFTDERALVEALHEAAAARTAAMDGARREAARMRSLNDRMHAQAIETIRAARESAEASIRDEAAREIERIEEHAAQEAERVRREEAKIRADAARHAEKAEEEARGKYEERIWMAESVYEAALPEIRKWREAQVTRAESARTQVAALVAEAESVVRGYRQRPLRAAPVPDAPADAASIRDAAALLQERLAALRACRSAGIFRGPILAVPGILVPAAGAGIGALVAGPLGVARAPGALWGAVAGAALFVVATAVLWSIARREVRARHGAFVEVASRALGALERLRAAAERTAAEREAAAKARHDADMAAADGTFQPTLADIEQKLREYVATVDQRAPHYHAKVLKQRATAVNAAVATRDARLSESAARCDRALAEESARRDSVEAETAAAEDTAVSAARDAWRRAQGRIMAGIGALDEADRAQALSWTAADWERRGPSMGGGPPFLRIGELSLPLEVIPGSWPTEPDLAWPPGTPSGTWRLPALLAAPHRMSLVVDAPPERRAEGLAILQNAVARVLVGMPPGKARFTFVDPVGLGQSFAGFMHLADELELLVTDRVWTDQRHIEQRLADLTDHMETVIQKYLRNEYASLEDYNRQAGEIAEPYRFLVMADFPVNVSEQAARRFASILQSGARCGVHVLLLHDRRTALPAGLDASDLRRGALQVAWRDGPGEPGWRIDEGRAAELPFHPDRPPDDALLQRVARDVGRAAREGNRVEVPFTSVAPRPGERWTMSSAGSFRVALGRSGANRLQHLALGEGTRQHALVAGKTGSGKSSLLNALIVNTALWYSPDEVEFWLVDFKKGVEFKAYAANGLPHARAVAVESDREFGLSVLQGLDDELRRRGELFRSENVQNIADWRALGRPDRMPRCLLVVDEFQELFIEDDKVAQDSALLLDRLVRQGRAFGMHVVLGSQTLGGAYGIARSTMGQMGVRIALQCNEADSQLILSDDNTAARLLTRPGEAIYNDAGGLVEGNSPFQVVWIGDEERESRLREVAAFARTKPGPARPAPIVFEGNQPADPASNAPLLESLARPDPGRAQFAPKVWFGDAVSIKEPTNVSMVRRSGSNVAIVGQRDEAACALLAMAMLSIAAQVPAAGPRLVVLDGTTPDDRLHGALAAVRAALPHDVAMPSLREAGDAVVALGEALARRTADGASDAPGIYLLVNGLHRFRALRRNEDDFGYGAGDGPPTPDKVLALLLKEGPLVGIHCILWADTVAGLQRSVDRNAMRELDTKVLFQMGANDSSALIDGPAASRLGFHRGLVSNDEAGTLEKFRPYSLPAAGFLARVRDALRARTP
ncbi:MAG: FtsK/SpoIIIE domain-containing protein [Phycisphaerales bacterium]